MVNLLAHDQFICDVAMYLLNYAAHDVYVGPFIGTEMNSWKEQGYFKDESIVCRRVCTRTNKTKYRTQHETRMHTHTTSTNNNLSTSSNNNNR